MPLSGVQVCNPVRTAAADCLQRSISLHDRCYDYNNVVIWRVSTEIVNVKTKNMYEFRPKSTASSLRKIGIMRIARTQLFFRNQKKKMCTSQCSHGTFTVE